MALQVMWRLEDQMGTEFARKHTSGITHHVRVVLDRELALSLSDLIPRFRDLPGKVIGEACSWRRGARWWSGDRSGSGLLSKDGRSSRFLHGRNLSSDLCALLGDECLLGNLYITTC